MHEASLHSVNSFGTFTVDDAHLRKDGSLKRDVFPAFMKRLRKEIAPKKVRYFYVGEYGSRTQRPHYHALLFGFRPEDAEQLSVRGDFPVYTSRMLSELWKEGLHEFGSVTEQSAAYCARYVRKRITGSWAKAAYGDRLAPFARMSRNPGIGAGWIDKFAGEVYPADAVVVKGKTIKPPRYYDLRVAERDGPLMDGVKAQRQQDLREVDLAAAEVICEKLDSLQQEGSL